MDWEEWKDGGGELGIDGAEALDTEVGMPEL